MSISKKQLLEIHSLKLSGIIDKMDNHQFEEYCKKLLAFTENFPVQEAELKNLFNSKDYNTFFKVLSGIKEELEKIHAIDLSNSSLRLMDELKTQKYQIVEAHLIYFMAEVSELSIDIQMALQKSKPSNEAITEVLTVKKIEQVNEVDEIKSILAVDDVSLTLNSLKMALKDTKYKLIGVRSGKDALRYIRDNSPDLFILDIEMPEMNGYELAKLIRQFGKTAPIIFLTGNAKQEYVIKAIEAGGIDFIIKPVNTDSVLERIKKYIG